jgi:hypothetical protein
MELNRKLSRMTARGGARSTPATYHTERRRMWAVPVAKTIRLASGRLKKDRRARNCPKNQRHGKQIAKRSNKLGKKRAR